MSKSSAQQRNWLKCSALALVFAVTVSGCTSAVDGSPTRVAGTFTADGVELELLDTGNYPTAPLPAFGTAETAEAGAQLEAGRLASFVVPPWDLDPSLVKGLSMGRSYRNAEALDELLPVPYDAPANPMVNAAAAHNFVAGYSSTRARSDSGADRLGIQNAVLIFPDDTSAKAAATEMAAAFATAWPDFPSTPAPIPNHPDAVAFSDDFGEGPQVKSFSADGRYVLYERGIAASTEAAAQLIATAIDAQRALLDKFTPTEPAKLVDLPLDPLGLLTRVLPYEEPGITHGRVRPPAAELHNEFLPIIAQELYDETGLVAAAATGSSNVYETSFDDGGKRFRDGFVEGRRQQFGMEDPAPGVSGMPNVECFSKPPQYEGDSTSFQCYGYAGKYAFVVNGLQELAVHQMAAAQYLMLIAP